LPPFDEDRIAGQTGASKSEIRSFQGAFAAPALKAGPACLSRNGF